MGRAWYVAARNVCDCFSLDIVPPLLPTSPPMNSMGVEGYFDSVTSPYLCSLRDLSFQGVTNTATSEPSLRLLSKLTVFSNVGLVDPSQAAGKLFMIVCYFLSRYSEQRAVF